MSDSGRGSRDPDDGPTGPAAPSELPGAGDPELASHAAAFRTGLRAEAAEWERLAARDRLRRRTLHEALSELATRGDVVAVRVGERRWQGVVAAVGRDVALLAADAGEVAVRLHAPVVWEVAPDAGGAPPTSDRPAHGGAPTLAAWLAAREADAAPLTVHGPELLAAGRVEAAASDHLLLRGGGGQLVVVPLAAVAVVSPG